MIEFEDLNKSVGATHILRNIKLMVAPGEKIAVIGPSGSGKSTLLHCINGFESFDSGKLTVMGHLLHDRRCNLQALRAEVGMVFQGFFLFPHLTVLRNIMLGPVQVRGWAPADVEAHARQLLDKVGLPDKANHYPSQLSGGQAQRVAIARALAMRPQGLLFDEPTSALDPEMTKGVLDTMMQLGRDGLTMAMVTHEMAFAREFADRIIFIDRGEIIEDSPPAQFFERPKTERARDFLIHSGRPRTKLLG
ncbi:MAG: amino acid ABC transporter ATP-binding protein [Candidatus Sericytochromatia bacterium]|nr:amino acid ABC transporter ATP-binding protein [Candidatus Sericytochromatia bacterium]